MSFNILIWQKEEERRRKKEEGRRKKEEGKIWRCLSFNSPDGKSRALPKGSVVWESRALCV
ncbi:MAG: hypothetical protein F6K17_20540 [Okeania sp. SIO3C4]|nr:hypothetical protein [Okeania sp. SIO3C4]